MDNYNSLQDEKEPDDLMKENILRKNKKKIAQSTDLPGKSMLKKSDLSLVFIGAGIITLIIFFVFLRPSDDVKVNSETADIVEDTTPSIEETVKTLEQKLTTLEEMLQSINASQAAMENQPNTGLSDIKPYVARIERVETALSVKFDVLTARVDKMDDKLSAVIRDVEKNSRIVNNIKNLPPPTVRTSKQTESVENKPVIHKKDKSETTNKVSVKSDDKGTATVNKTAANTKSESVSSSTKQKSQSDTKSETLYHTVAKGDTLYNISKRYNTTVEQLRAMNKMSLQDAIVIGEKIIVKK